jgi:hypothetical protein
MTPQSRESILTRPRNAIGRRNEFAMDEIPRLEGLGSRKKELERSHRDDFEKFLGKVCDDVYRDLTAYRTRRKYVD